MFFKRKKITTEELTKNLLNYALSDDVADQIVKYFGVDNKYDVIEIIFITTYIAKNALTFYFRNEHEWISAYIQDSFTVACQDFLGQNSPCQNRLFERFIEFNKIIEDDNLSNEDKLSELAYLLILRCKKLPNTNGARLYIEWYLQTSASMFGDFLAAQLKKQDLIP